MQRTFHVSMFILLIVTPAWSQQKIASIPQFENQLIARNGEKSSETPDRNHNSITELPDQFNVLLQRKNALQKYLLSINPMSQDYKVTEASIMTIETKLKNLEKEFQGTLFAKAYPSRSYSEVPNSSIQSSPGSAANSRLAAIISAKSSRNIGGLSVSNSKMAEDDRSGQSLQDLIRGKIETLKAKLDQTSKTKQTETPSMSENSTSLVDQSSASDLIGVALNLSGLSAKSNDENKMEADSISVTASAYSLYSAFQGVDPLNPVFYNENHYWRRAFVTLGFDNEKMEGTETTDRAKLFGVKVLLIDQRDPSSDRYANDFRALRESVTKTGSTFSNLNQKAIAFIFRDTRVREIINREFGAELENAKNNAIAQAKTDPPKQKEVDRINELIRKLNAGQLFIFDPRTNFLAEGASEEEAIYYAKFFQKYLSQTKTASLGEDVLNDVDMFIDQELEKDFTDFKNLDEEARKLIGRIRKAPQFSIFFLTKQREQGVIDDYMGELIFDYGLGDRVNATLNGAFEYKNSRLIGGDTRGGRFAGQLQFRFNKRPESLFGKKPVYFYLATDNKFQTGKKPIFMGQAKLTIPIADGFDLPLSLTYANRTELIKESVVRGQFGFTFDTARIIRAFLAR